MATHTSSSLSLTPAVSPLSHETRRSLLRDSAAMSRLSRSPSRSSSRGRLKREAREYDVRIKVVACLSLVCVQLFASIVLKLANAGGKYTFSPQSSLAWSELIKLVLSLLYILYDERSVRGTTQCLREQSSWRLGWHMFGLAALYCFNNALMFWLFARADPGSITLIKSGATVVSALMLYFVRGLRLSVCRWMVISVQMLALVVAQFDACEGRAHLASHVYAVLLLSLFNSSVANVWNEHVIKRFTKASLGVKNVYLYLMGALLNIAVFTNSRVTDKSTPAFFEGYNAMAVAVVCSNAFMGVAMNVVYKYADAVVKNIATSTTTVLLVIISAVFFGGRDNMMVFLGGGIVVMGTYLYFAIGVSEQHMSKLQQAQRKMSPSRESGSSSTSLSL
eukprot:TRINITY_DN40119_c0_g1_i1.p2 TRINITY_DN40119_c0_g1~~TRINITY_DN40119_c0_g1_i1.p2  ORF type:complete len:392 (+),score=65.87 TRINITY_DN40119_c0_g1_i1:402-1577(+)